MFVLSSATAPGARLRRGVACGLALLVPFLFSGCAQLSAGKSYTLAKVDRTGGLVDAQRLLKPLASDLKADPLDQQVGTTLEIRLADYYLRYLQNMLPPSTVVFSRAVINDPRSPGAKEGIVYERVFLNTGSSDPAQNYYGAANQGAGGNLKDAVLVPAFVYTGQNVLIQIRVIELDQEDNRKLGQLLSTTGAAVSQLRPESASTISMVQAALTFLLANNPDDTEFAFDLELTGNSQAVFSTGEDLKLGDAKTLVTQPRIGHLAIIKTEHPDRLALPVNRVTLAAESLTWTLASATKLCTLNLANWWNRDKDYYDPYYRLFGNPLRVTQEAMSEPVVDTAGYLCHTHYVPCNPWRLFLWPAASNQAFRYTYGQLMLQAPGLEQLTRFDQKSYMVLAIDSPAKGTDLNHLRELQGSLEDLKTTIHTSLNDEEMQAKVKKAMQDVLKQLALRQAEEEASRLLGESGATPETVKPKVEKTLKDSLSAMGVLETADALQAEVRKKLDDFIDQLQARKEAAATGAGKK